MGAMLCTLLFTAYVVFGGPARPVMEETVVVLPGENGHIGGVVVQRGSQKVVLDTAYASSHLGLDGQLKSSHASPEQVQKEFGKTVAALPAPPAKFILYFVTGGDQLTEESKARLKDVLAEIRERPIPDVLLIGHTDTVGGTKSNDVLSRQRAERVREILLQAGIKVRRIVVTGRGERDLMVPTGNDVQEARNRGVEINVR